MFVDASALVGILAREIDAPTLAGRVGEAERVFTSPVAIYEAVLGLARARNTSIGNAERVVANFLSAARAEIIPISPEIGRMRSVPLTGSAEGAIRRGSIWGIASPMPAPRRWQSRSC